MNTINVTMVCLICSSNVHIYRFEYVKQFSAIRHSFLSENGICLGSFWFRWEHYYYNVPPRNYFIDAIWPVLSLKGSMYEKRRKAFILMFVGNHRTKTNDHIQCFEICFWGRIAFKWFASTKSNSKLSDIHAHGQLQSNLIETASSCSNALYSKRINNNLRLARPSYALLLFQFFLSIQKVKNNFPNQTELSTK